MRHDWRRLRATASLLLALTLVGLSAIAAPARGPGGRLGGAVRNDTPSPEKPPAGFRDDPLRPVVESLPGDPPHATTNRTNIVVVMIDDIAEMDDQVWQRLPNIRKLFLEHGLRFTSYYGDTPLCCPGRANFLTGLETIHHGVDTNSAPLFRPTMTVATQLQRAGYYTFIAGKYLNLTRKLTDKTPPGWTRSAITGGAYYDYSMWVDGRLEFHDHDANDYSTDVAANKALRFLRLAPANRPVFGFITPFAVHDSPHAPPLAAPRHVDDARCAGLAPWDPPSYNEADVSDKPGYVASKELLADADGWDLKPVCEPLLAVDELVGRVWAELLAQGRASRTLFVLTDDNGMNFGAHRLKGKSTPYATPMPLFMHWGNGFGTAPGTIEGTVMNYDLAPTLCAVGGCHLGPYPTGQAGPDGRSLLKVMLARGGSLKRDMVLHSHPRDWFQHGLEPGWFAVRTTERSHLGRWLYVAYTDGERELYDLAADPWMLQNQAGQPAVADVQSTLDGRLLGILGGPVPTPRPSPTPVPTPTPVPSEAPSPGP